MVAISYMTRTDTQTIWDVALDSTRYDKVAVRIAEQLNFWVNADATEQVVNTAVTPMLEQLSEEILLELIQASKSYAVEKPWDFIQAKVARISTRILVNYDLILKKIKTILGEKFSIKYSNELPLKSHSD